MTEDRKQEPLDVPTLAIKRDPRQVADVRRFVREVFESWGLDDEVATLIASELATNAIMHGSQDTDRITVRLCLYDGFVWVEVEDASADSARVHAVDNEREDGRGLYLVEQLASCWGVRRRGQQAGKVVFAVVEPIPA